VKDLRVGLFQSKPPVTRVVLDLKSAQSYQVFPSGRTVIIKVMGGGAGVSAGFEDSPSAPARRPGLVVANYTTRAEPVSVVAAPEPVLDVTYHNGLLGIRANKATLSEVLFAVQQRTGAEVSIAAGAEQEKVVAEIAPGPAPEVLAHLLNGSKFNFLIMNAADDPTRLDRVILSTRPEGGYSAPPLRQVQTTDDSDDREPASMNIQPGNRQPAPVQVPPQGEGKPLADDNTPDQ
jgi:hypothetical protein